MIDENYIYGFQDYRVFLIEALGGEKKRTGQRGALARHLDCQTAYLSQVLSGTANLSLEQAYRVNKFFHHDAQASEYFLWLVQKERAGTKELKQFFQGKIEQILNKRNEILSRVNRNAEVSEQDQAHYYSQWHFAAIHIALSIPQLQTLSQLCQHFHLDEGVVRDALEFLMRAGLVIYQGGQYRIGPSHIHLPKDSRFIKNLHANWRLQALQSLDRRREEDLHYSVAYSLSREDAVKIRQLILKCIEDNMKVVKPSPEEVLYCNTIDFFEVKG